MRYRKLEIYTIRPKYKDWYMANSVKVGEDYYLCLNGSVEELKQYIVEAKLDGKRLRDYGYGKIVKDL